MADKQQFIIEGIAKIDSVLDSIKKIQSGLSGLKVPDNLQKQFENLYKKAVDQGEKAKKALSSGFETKGSVKEYTVALEGISRIYGEILGKTKDLKLDKDFLSVNFNSLDKANKELERLEGELKAVKEEAKNAKNNAQKVFTGVANYYSNTKNYKNPFKEWSEAAEALRKNDIPGVKAALDALEQKFQGKNTDSGPWAKRYEALQKLKNAFASYEQEQSKVVAVDQKMATQQQVVSNEMDNAAKSLDPLVELMDKAVRESEEFANSETKAAKSTQQLNSELEHFKSKAAYFFGISNAINLFKRSLRSAYDTVKDLDAVMTETAVVTNFSVGDMWSQLPEYTARANELGVTIHDTYEAATLFYQQGLKTNEVMQISNETLKMARIAGLDAATASDRMTNALRGFNMELDKTSAQRVNDVYSKLAAITASNTDEISTAMTKVASLAHNANMEFETTAAFLAQIIESTRESAETAGTALKTVVARFSEVKELYSKGELLGEDEEGEEIDVNKVSTALRTAGINLNEYLTGTKGLDDIFMELAEKWNDLDIIQQRYIATMAAGSRQQSRFIALMSDYKRTMELVDAANNANGASQQQYEKTLESLQTKLARLKNAWNEFILGLANSDAIKGAVDLLTSLITAINNLIKLISNGNAGVKMVTTFFTAFTAFKVGKSLIGKNSVVTNFFARLVGDSTIVAKGSASQIATSFYSQLADKIANPTKNTKGNIATDLYNYFNPANTAHIAGLNMSKDDVLTNLVNKFDSNVSNDTIKNFREEVGSGLEAGTLTIDQLNNSLEKAGQSFRITGKNAEECGLVLENNNGIIDNNITNFKRLSASAMVLGGILIAAGDRLEQMEGPAQTFGSIIKGLGTGLMVFGTIMSVYLPLQAQLMAKGVTSAIVSIPIVGWIVGIIAAITALGVAIYNFAKNNSAETKLEKSTEAAKNAADAANEAKEAYEKLNEAFTNLDDKRSILDNAIKGTQEWRDAIKEVNAAVIELMNNYDGIEIERDENGVLSITASSRKELEDRMSNEVAVTEAYSRVAKIREYEDEINKRRADLKPTVTSGRQEMAGFNDPSDELLLNYIDNLEELKNMSSEVIKELLKGTYAYGNKINYDLDEGVRKIENYIAQYENNINALESEKTALGGIFLENANIDESLKKYANNLITDDYVDSLIENNKKTYEKDNKSDLQTKVADLYDMTWKQFVDKNPDFKDYSEDKLRDYLATNDALKEVNEQLQIFAGNINNFTEAEKALLEKKEGGGLTDAQIRELQNGNREELYGKLGGEGRFGDPDAFNKWLDNILNIAATSFDTTKYGEKFGDIFESSFNYITKNLDANTFKTFMDNIYSIYRTSGEEGLKKVRASLGTIIAELDPDEVDSFVKSINNLDWASADSLNELDKLAKEFGISEEVMKDFKNQIVELNNAVKQFDAESLKSALNLAKNISSGEQGRSFSKEQYEIAIANGANPGDFTYNIETDAYEYIGQDIQDVRAAILEQTAIMRQQLAKQVASNEAVEKLQNNGVLPTDENDIEQLKNFLMGYKYIAEDNAMFSQDFLNTATEEQIRAMYDTVMQEYYTREDTKADLALLNQSEYQTNTGMENADIAFQNSDTQAIEALKQQIVTSGLPEAIVQALLESVNTGDLDQMRSAGGVVDTVDKASQFGIDPETLATYAETLREVNDLEGLRMDTLYELALLNANYENGFKSVLETYEDWIELEREDGSLSPEKGNLKQIETYKQLKESLQQMFSLTQEISDEFFKMPENVELLKQAVEGDLEAINQLRANIAKLEIPVELSNEDMILVYQAIDDLMAQSYDLEFGATLDDTSFIDTLINILEQCGFTVQQINDLFQQIGWTPPIETKEVPFTTAQELREHGYGQWVDSEGNVHTVPTEGEVEVNQNGMVTVPVVGETSYVPPQMPSYTPHTSSSGGGGGGGGGRSSDSGEKEEKPTYWKNPYDELYNLNEKINESIRTREKLERRYQKLLKQETSTLGEIRGSYREQIQQLSQEADLQRQLAAGRLRQINNLGNQKYTDSEGNRTTYNRMGVTRYASYDPNTGLLQIDWAGLERLANDPNRKEEGEAAQAYISELEKLVSSYEEVQNKLWDIEDQIEALRKEVIESYLSFEDRVMDALVNRYQKEIDRYQATSEALEKADNEIIDALREQVELSRQIRDNTEKEQDISDMENRLAYLRRDTSGANDLEILKLQQNLDDARQDYTDQLIDQAIDNMEKDASLAAEQRNKQIEIMQTQLDIAKDTGALWKEVHDIINDAAAGDGALSPQSNLIRLLEESEGFKALSAIGKETWFEEAAEAFHKAWMGLEEAEDKYKVDANDDGKVLNTGTQAAVDKTSKPVSTSGGGGGGSSSGGGGSNKKKKKEEKKQEGHDDATIAGVAMNICGPNQGWGNYPERKERLEEKGFSYSEVQSIVNDIVNSGWDDSYYRDKYGISDVSAYSYYAFKLGGLADFTGPAWLDGTKSRPELILNAQDTANFIALKDILASLLNSQNNENQSPRKGGDNYFDIDINANIGSDYDVDKLTEKIKKDIFNDGQYRNVNVINFLR